MAQAAPTAPTPPLRRCKVSTAARSIGMSHMTIRRLVASGELTGYRLGTGRTLLVDLDELEALMKPIPTAGG